MLVIKKIISAINSFINVNKQKLYKSYKIMKSYYLLHRYVGWSSHDSTVILFGGHQDVPVVTPVVGPTIFNQPVILSVDCTVTHRQNSVI
jgi:hypothetical protein